jgi:hypothetical protein
MVKKKNIFNLKKGLKKMTHVNLDKEVKSETQAMKMGLSHRKKIKKNTKVNS